MASADSGSRPSAGGTAAVATGPWRSKAAAADDRNDRFGPAGLPRYGLLKSRCERGWTDAQFDKITGFNYFQRSQVYFNNIPVPTRVLNRAEIEATIDESLLRTPGRYPIVVKNLGLADPANTRVGDGTSNTGWLIVNYR